MQEVLLSDLLAGTLSRNGEHTLQRQIYEVVRRSVLDHTLVSGQKLPSSRQLAQELGISRITVSLAYDRLIAESYLRASSGSGTFVAETGASPRTAPTTEQTVRPWTGLARRGEQLSRGRGGVAQHAGAFVPGVADAALFPFHIWKRLVARHLVKSDLALAGYSKEGAGFRPLREAIASYLAISRSVVCDADQVIVTAGTHQSIDLCARMLTDIGDAALLEDPCHWAFPSVLSAAGVQVATAAMDEQGVDLRSTLIPENARLVATSPSHQYPTGVVMTLARRLELLEDARRKRLWVIEDDYDSEFRYDGIPIPSLQGLDTDGQVIYMGTFSKATFPGMRMSYMVVPRHLAQPFSRACAEIYRPGHLHLQAGLADFIADGHFSQHVRRMRIEYGERQEALRAALARELGDAVSLSQARAGLHLFARLTGQVNMDRFVDETSREGLVIRTPHFVVNRCAVAKRAMVLGFGAVPMDEIEPGVRRLGQALERATALNHAARR